MDSARAICTDALDRPGNPLQQVDVVDGLIHDCPAAVELPCAAPPAVVVVLVGAVPGCETSRPGDLAEPAFFGGLLNGAVSVAPAILIDRRETDAFFLRRFDEPIDAVELDLKRLLADHIDAAIDREHAMFFVVPAGGGDVENIDIFLLEHLDRVRVNRDSGQASLFEGNGCFCWSCITNRHQACIAELRDHAHVCAADRVCPQNRTSPFFGHC